MRPFLGAVAALVLASTVDAPARAPSAAPPRTGSEPVSCTRTDTLDAGAGADYYTIPLYEPATAFGRPDTVGRVEVAYPSSPFGVPLTRDGQLRQRLTVMLDEDWRADRSRLVAWVTPPELRPVIRLGALGPDGTAAGEVALNKFLIFITREPSGSEAGDGWSGTVLLKGKSRSGRMQSMASHGMFEPEPC